MKVGLVCPYSLSVPGGVQNQVMGLARAFRARGHEARVIAPCDGPPPATFVTPVGNSVLNPSNGSIAPIAPDPSAQFRTMRALWDERFDLLHLHEPFVPGPALTASLMGRAPIVATFHAAGEQPAYEYLAPMARWIARRFDARVAVSQDALDLVAPVVGGKWTILYNGVDIPVPSKQPRQGQTVFFLGRHEPRKGLEVLLQAEPMLSEGTTVWVAGDGETTDELKARHPSSRIQWLGRISDAERDRRLAEATVFCAPSLGGESFGIILLEAMAAGAAVVASRIPGYEKVATAPSPSGVPQVAACAELAEPGDPTSLARSINRVLGDADHRRSLVEAGLDRAGQFNLDGLCMRYLALYDWVISTIE